MPLTLEDVQSIQADAMADDVEIDMERMSLWSRAELTAFFESGGETVPTASVSLPVPATVTFAGPPVVVSFYSGGNTAEQGRKQLTHWASAVRKAGLQDHLILDPPTERPSPSEDLNQYLVALAAEIDAVPERRGRPILAFGHSHGALYAYCLAAWLGERCCRLVVAARRPPTDPLLDCVWGVKDAAGFCALRDEDILKGMYAAWPNRMLEQLLPFPATEWPPWMHGLMKVVRRQYSDVTVGLGTAEWANCAAAKLPKLACHVLAVAAEDEKAIGETAARMRDWATLVGSKGRFETSSAAGGHLEIMQPATLAGPPPPFFAVCLAGL